MASTYSDLKIQLMATGENSGTWGTITNTNLGTAIEEAITGSADVAFSSADVTLTLTNTNETQAARNLRLNLTGTSGGNRNLIVPAIEKVYIINNGLANQVTVKNATGTGVVVPTGKTMYVYNDGTNVVDAITHLTSLTLGSALPVASGGTGITSFGTGIATFLGTPSSANLAAAVTDETGTGALVFASSPALAGVPTTPTAAAGANTTQVASTAHVFAERTNTATLTNKTVSVDNNTVSGIAASSFVLSNASGNVDGAAAQKVIPSGVVVGTTDTQTLTNKTLTSPAITAPTGIVKGDVGLGNVDNTSDATKNSATATLTNKTLTNPAINGFTGDTSVINIGSGQVYKDASGFVGIGTTPSYILDVNVVNSTDRAVNLYNSDTVLSDGENAHSILFTQNDNSNPNTTHAWIKTFTNGSTGSLSMAFATGSGGTATERMRITSAGDVGIGTSSPTGKLQVRGNSIAQDEVFVTIDRSDGAVSSVIKNGASGNNGITFGTTTGHVVAFQTNNTERLRITASGDVGIGTSSPSFPLTIVKTISDQSSFWSDSTPTLTGNFGNVWSNYQTSTSTHVAAVKLNSASTTTGYITFHTNGANERARITSDGNLLVGTTSAYFGARLSVVTSGIGASINATGTGITAFVVNTASATNQYAAWLYNDAQIGSISTNGSVVAYNTSSDYRLKENVAPMQNALDTVAQLNPVTYTWKVDGSAGQGFIAHELQAVVPDAVTGEKDAVDKDGNPQYQGVDTSFLVATLTAAIQELSAKVDTLQAELNTLKGN